MFIKYLVAISLNIEHILSVNNVLRVHLCLFKQPYYYCASFTDEKQRHFPFNTRSHKDNK